jgi:hypothetical protein
MCIINIKTMEIRGMTYNEYHKKYYQDKIKGEKRLCLCGLEVDKFRFARHFRSKKHLKAMDKKNISEISDDNIEKII